MKAQRLWTVCIFFSIGFMHGLTHGQMAAASLQVSPTQLDFGTQVVGSESRPEVISVSNPTSLTITLAEVIASGIDFPAKSDCRQISLRALVARSGFLSSQQFRDSGSVAWTSPDLTPAVRTLLRWLELVSS